MNSQELELQPGVFWRDENSLRAVHASLFLLPSCGNPRDVIVGGVGSVSQSINKGRSQNCGRDWEERRWSTVFLQLQGSSKGLQPPLGTKTRKAFCNCRWPGTCKSGEGRDAQSVRPSRSGCYPNAIALRLQSLGILHSWSVSTTMLSRLCDSTVTKINNAAVRRASTGRGRSPCACFTFTVLPRCSPTEGFAGGLVRPLMPVTF